MGEKSQISHEELQIIYVGILPSWRGSIVSTQVWAARKSSLQSTMWKCGWRKSNFTVKPGKHHLSQVIKVNINSDKSC